MRVLMINTSCGVLSTGRICVELAEDFEEQGHEVKIAYGRMIVPEDYEKFAVKIGNRMDQTLHGIRTRLLDEHGFGSKRVTEKFLNWAEEYNPDLLWLHNIHGYYINVELLFEWIKKRPEMQVKWTLHDCWAFTGHCAYFTMAKCESWREQCFNCPQKKAYPASILFDCSLKNFGRKKSAFLGVKNMTLVTPSFWLKDIVEKSFLGEYEIEVKYNNVNTEYFKPTLGDFRRKYGIEKKKMLLGVANVWDERKGLNDFLQLEKLLDDSYVIVLVGLSKKQIKKLPANIIGLERTYSVNELAEIYTTADVYVNPSKEETFGMTTVEAIACGTYAIVYKGTACEEIVMNENGVAVPLGVENLYKEIQNRFEID